MTLAVIPAWPSRVELKDDYNDAVYLFGSSLASWATAADALQSACQSDAYAAKAAADNAGAVIWVSGTTYADGFIVFSPTSYKNYRRKGAGGGTTDPASDPTNWADITTMPKITRDARTSNTILAGGDHGKAIEITSGTFSQTFTAAATLTSGWQCIIYNSGTGVITLDPDGTETIDGLTSYPMYSGEARIITCNGTAFFTQIIKGFCHRFTADATFIRPPGYKAFAGYLWGGGQSGQRTNAAAVSKGGAGGGCTPFMLTASQMGASQALTIGQGGAAVSGVAEGTNGGNTTLGSLITGYGGGQVVANGGGGLSSSVAASPVGYGGGTSQATPAKSVFGGAASSSDGSASSGSAIVGGAGGSSIPAAVGTCAVTLLGSIFTTTAGAKSVTATPAVGDLILICVFLSDENVIPTPTDNNSSGTYTKIGSNFVVSSGNYRDAAWYVRDALIASGSSTIFSLSAPSSDSGGGLAVIKVTGMTKFGLDAVRQYKAANDTASTPATGTWTSSKLTTNPVVGAVICDGSSPVVTPTSGYTEIVDTGWATPNAAIQIQKIDSGDTTNTMTWGGVSSGTARSVMGVELDASAPGTPASAGTSLIGGNGGAGSSASNGTAGSVPGGGGGATQTGTNSGAGGNGAADIWGI